MEGFKQKTPFIEIDRQFCMIRLPSLTKPTFCRLLFWSDKIIEIQESTYYSQQLQTKTSKKKKSQKCIGTKIVLDFNMRVQIIPHYSIQQFKFKQGHPAISFIFKNYKTSQKFYLEIMSQNISEQVRLFYHYVQKFLWIKGLRKYKILHQFAQKYCDSTFFVLRNARNLQNVFAKRIIKKKYQLQNNSKKYDIEPIIRQIQFQNKIHSSYIMKYEYFFDDGKYFYLLFQQMPIITLFQDLQSMNSLLPSNLKKMVRHMLKAINQLSSHNIIHRNIKSSSFFVVQRNKKLRLCLAEFQHAQYIFQQPKNQINIKVQQLPPQLIKGNKYYLQNISKSDIFSLGVLWFQMMFNKKLFDKKRLINRIQNEEILLQNIQCFEYRILSPSNLELFKKCIQYDPQIRISAQQALVHAYFTDKMNESKHKQNQNLMYESTTYVKRSSIYDSVPLNVIKTSKERKALRFSSPLSFDAHLLEIKNQNRYDLKQKQFIDTYEQYGQNIEQNYMDDTHTNFMLKDARIMKPSIQAKQY